MQKDQQMQQENMKAQADANAQQQQAAAEAEVQKKQAELQNEIQLETTKGEIKKSTLHAEAEVKKLLMDHEFALNMKMKEMELEMLQFKQDTIEDNKNKREEKQQGHQKSLEKQKAIDKTRDIITEKGFESSGNDVIGGGMRLGAFEPS